MTSMPIYVPVRDTRFEYAVGAIQFLERNQCSKCTRGHASSEFASQGCVYNPIPLLFEESVPTILDAGDDGIVCSMFQESSFSDEATNNRNEDHE